MNYVISIINPNGQRIMADILKKLAIPVTLELLGRGTALKSTLELLGLESRERRIVMAVATEEQTATLIREEKRRLYIDAPGNGVVISVPVKSVGGGSTLAYLSGGQAKKKAPELRFEYELILAIANEGYTDAVMDAARAAGAAGGTVLHAKGTGAANAEKFFQVSIAQEKEIVLIVAKAENKTAIMESVLRLAGPKSEAGAILLSLPVTDVAGFGMIEE
ncbi:MAG: P-II family nitrogen regulator, partial [Eubacteriales bacterium]|nr:P-II family nitrogen regulator [Eubacteriales bacterium]